MPDCKVIQIREHEWRIEDDTVRVFLFEGAERALLVDSGKTLDNMYQIVRELTTLPIQLVNTHVDFDHIACNGQFEAAYMHPSEFAFYHKAQGRSEPVKALWDNDIIDLGARHFRVLHTPGHTPGSISLLDEENRILVGGDGIQNGRIFLFGPVRDLLAYLVSLKRLWELRESFDTVYPSHAAFPMPAEQIQRLIQGTERVLRGEVLPVEERFGTTPIRAYDIGAATLLCDRDIGFSQ